MNKKLGRPTDQRMAMLKNQTSSLLWYGRIETTYDRAASISAIAEKLLTLAINSYKDEVTVKKEKENLKGEKVTVDVKQDGPTKLAARRALMADLYNLTEIKAKNEKKSAYKARTKLIKHPLIEKIFNDYAPKYDERISKSKQGGGYTRIYKTYVRRGDNAQMAIIELV